MERRGFPNPFVVDDADFDAFVDAVLALLLLPFL
jgi:hypothetical protein